jgi:hypothetical protein
MCDRAIWLDHGRVVAEGTAATVVHQYRERDKAVEAEHLAETAGPKALNRWGSRKIEIVQVALTNGKGEERAIFETGETLVLEMGYQAHDAVTAPIFGMAIHRHDGVHITGPNTSFAGLTLPTLDGSGTVTFTIPYLPLLEGLYYISVAVLNYNDTEMFDYHDRCYPFRVVRNDGVRERFGMMTLRGEWRYASSSLNANASPGNRSN